MKPLLMGTDTCVVHCASKRYWCLPGGPGFLSLPKHTIARFTMTNKNDIGEILDIPSERVDSIIDSCYEKMDKLEKDDSAAKAIVEFMLSQGNNDKEKFLAGFLLGRVYNMNLSSAEEAEHTAKMFR